MSSCFFSCFCPQSPSVLSPPSSRQDRDPYYQVEESYREVQHVAQERLNQGRELPFNSETQASFIPTQGPSNLKKTECVANERFIPIESSRSFEKRTQNPENMVMLSRENLRQIGNPKEEVKQNKSSSPYEKGTDGQNSFKFLGSWGSGDSLRSDSVFGDFPQREKETKDQYEEDAPSEDSEIFLIEDISPRKKGSEASSSAFPPKLNLTASRKEGENSESSNGTSSPWSTTSSCSLLETVSCSDQPEFIDDERVLQIVEEISKRNLFPSIPSTPLFPPQQEKTVIPYFNLQKTAPPKKENTRKGKQRRAELNFNKGSFKTPKEIVEALKNERTIFHFLRTSNMQKTTS